MKMLAFDHRAAFEGLTEDVPAAKRVVYEGALLAAAERPGERLGIFVDEQYGAAIARAAKTHGLAVAMPVERGDAAEFEFAYADFGAHLDAFEPDFAKALVRWSEASAPRTLARLQEIDAFLRGRPTAFLLELITGDVEATVAAMAAIGDAGIRPDVWKLEPFAGDGLARMARAAAGIPCVLLGGGEADETIAARIVEAAATDGFVGFTIGRTIWAEPLDALLAGEASGAEASRAIADTYIRYIDLYRAA